MSQRALAIKTINSRPINTHPFTNPPPPTSLSLTTICLFSFPSYPLLLLSGLAAEMTYPIPADNSAALLFTGAITVFFFATIVLTGTANE